MVDADRRLTDQLARLCDGGEEARSDALARRNHILHPDRVLGACAARRKGTDPQHAPAGRLREGSRKAAPRHVGPPPRRSTRQPPARSHLRSYTGGAEALSGQPSCHARLSDHHSRLERYAPGGRVVDVSWTCRGFAASLKRQAPENSDSRQPASQRPEAASRDCGRTTVIALEAAA